MSEKIQLSYYNTEAGEIEKDISVLVYQIAKRMNSEQFAELLTDYCNSFTVDFETGEKVGKHLSGKHRTLQATVGRMCLGILVGLSEQKFTDARNEKIVALGKQLKEMIKDGTLNMGYMI